MKNVAIRVFVATSLLVTGGVGSVLAQHNPTVHDKDVRVVDFSDLSYPSIAATARAQGVVVVQAKLDDQGRVADAEVLSGSEPLIPAWRTSKSGVLNRIPRESQ
jgi:Gram-negative bacterial TonB protein C-terminal